MITRASADLALGMGTDNRYLRVSSPLSSISIYWDMALGGITRRRRICGRRVMDLLGI